MTTATTATTATTRDTSSADNRITVRPVHLDTWIGPPRDNEAYGSGRKATQYIKISYTPESGELTAHWNESYNSRTRSWGYQEPEDFHEGIWSETAVRRATRARTASPS
ncbi:hypothetical protein OG871_37995 [Kitasatospora sp. NBC_00374]|uniref:hypothetical protein n=1 Tax=Kitasatospora sp. NBC_00374 TaxID=2975964 RepID=UPI003250A971